MSGKSALLVLLAVTLLISHTAGASSGEVVVAITHPSLKSVVTAIGGARVRVIVLVPPGVDAHHYEPPTSELLALLRDADVVVMTGPSHLPVEHRVEELHKTGLYRWILIDYEEYVDEGLELLVNPATGRENPHEYVLSITGLRIVATSVYRALSSLDPGGAGYYESRLRSYLEHLEKLEKVVKTTARSPGVARVGLFTPILQYAASDTGLLVTYVVLAEHEAPLEARDVAKAAENYGKQYDVLVVSDEELAKYRQAVEELLRRGVKVVAVPLSTLAYETPELVPLVIATGLGTLQIPVVGAAGGPIDLSGYVAISLPLLAVILALVLYILRLRSLGKAAK